MKILYKAWFTNRLGTVGIVVTENKMGKRKIRASTLGRPTTVEKDAEFIANYGFTIPYDALQEIMDTVDESR